MTASVPPLPAAPEPPGPILIDRPAATHAPSPGVPVCAKPRLVLASTSRYRQALLARLRLPFDVKAPQVDETAHPGETPADTAARLALAKAQAVSQTCPDAVVIGSDQLAELDGAPLGKPGSFAAARKQLRRMAGRLTVFHTAVAVVAPSQAFQAVEMARVEVRLRPLLAAEIDRYLALDTPYDCAGSAKVESLGIALAESITSDDPSALEGLPLIRTCRLLRRVGLDPLAQPE